MVEVRGVSQSRGVGVQSVRPSDEGDAAVLECVCDCGQVTEITLVLGFIAEAVVPAREFAFTCDRCQSSHWLTVGLAPVEGAA